MSTVTYYKDFHSKLLSDLEAITLEIERLKKKEQGLRKAIEGIHNLLETEKSSPSVMVVESAATTTNQPRVIRWKKEAMEHLALHENEWLTSPEIFEEILPGVEDKELRRRKLVGLSSALRELVDEGKVRAKSWKGRGDQYCILTHRNNPAFSGGVLDNKNGSE